MAAEFQDGAVPRFGSAAALPINIVSDRIFINSYSPYAVTADGRFISTQPVGHTRLRAGEGASNRRPRPSS